MISFLKEAAQNIDSVESFDEDPSIKFFARRKIYYAFLLVMLVNISLILMNLWEYALPSTKLKEELE
jgi:hypothetical protein